MPKRTTLRLDQIQVATYSTASSYASEDESRDAVPFAKEMLPKLTPTIRSFTLDGKVAVVTGYVLFSLIFSRVCCSSELNWWILAWTFVKRILIIS